MVMTHCGRARAISLRLFYLFTHFFIWEKRLAYVETNMTTLHFTDENIGEVVNQLDERALDQLEFGVIGFDQESIVRRYNAYESNAAGIAPERVLGKHLFSSVAQCMNNYMVAQRFEDAQSGLVLLDASIDYVLTLRMRPTKVKLRLFSSPDMTMRYVFIQRQL
jgi:photoactive yellow protein